MRYLLLTGIISSHVLWLSRTSRLTDYNCDFDLEFFLEALLAFLRRNEFIGQFALRLAHCHQLGTRNALFIIA